MAMLITVTLPAIIEPDATTTTVVRFTKMQDPGAVEPAGVIRHPTVQAGLIQHGGHS